MTLMKAKALIEVEVAFYEGKTNKETLRFIKQIKKALEDNLHGQYIIFRRSLRSLANQDLHGDSVVADTRPIKVKKVSIHF